VEQAHEAPFDDLASFIAACQKHDDYREIRGADWNLEIGTLIEAVAESMVDPPLLLFDEIVGHEPGYRVASLIYASARRVAMALGLPPDASRLELARLAARRLRDAAPIAPRVVDTGEVLEHQFTGDHVDVLKFPALLFHEYDGGRYLGTGDTVVCRDPESGYVNAGTYRIQIHERDLLGLWMSPGQQGRQICERYWERGESAPVAATFGGDPLVFMASHQKLPWGTSELDFAGGLRGRPVDIIEGDVTGLPIPAHSEIAIEGEVPPPSKQVRDEGPFGEWPGYYAGGSHGTGEGQPVIRVQAVYHRNEPILHDQTPLWPGAPTFGIRFDAGLLWDQLEQAGVQDVQGVYSYNRYFIVVSIQQRFAGHALQAAMAVLGCGAGARNGRYVVIVDEDIDPSDINQVLWAMETRVDPATDIHTIDGFWSTPLDPRMPPERRQTRNYVNSRAIILAVRPFEWRDRFPQATRARPELRRRVVDKFRHLLDLPQLP
jgi:UbiD family decarboxylase